jgi:hypothetical protein
LLLGFIDSIVEGKIMTSREGRREGTKEGRKEEVEVLLILEFVQSYLEIRTPLISLPSNSCKQKIL